MSDTTGLTHWIEEEWGLDAASVGVARTEQAFHAAMDRMGVPDPAGALARLRTSPRDAAQLLDDLVVPETWFFRDWEPFVFLRKHAPGRMAGTRPARPLRILSIACSTGEEPYSVVMSMIDGGMSSDAFRVEAVDVSGRALAAARRAIFPAASFREADEAYRRRFFSPRDGFFALDRRVVEAVRFRKGNVTDPAFLASSSPWDVIFCRNLLIYLTPGARAIVLRHLDRLLRTDALLFVGYAEVPLLTHAGYEAVAHPRAFACRRARAFPARALPRRPPDSPSRARPAAKAERPRRPVLTPTPAIAPGAAPGRTDTVARIRDVADRGDIREAARMCRTYLAAHPAEAEAHFLMGLIEAAAGRPEAAERAMEHALYLDPTHYEAAVHLGLIYDRAGDGTRADAMRRRAARTFDAGRTGHEVSRAAGGNRR